jgi:hypothetical protein
MSSFYEPASYRHFMSYSDQCLFGNVLIHSTDFKANLTGPDSGNPEFGFSFAFTHPSLQRLGTYRLVRKYSDIDFSFAMQKMRRRNSTSFNMLGGYPALFQSLQAVFAKRYKIASRCITLHPAALALTVFNSFRHHCHFLKPFVKNKIYN